MNRSVAPVPATIAPSCARATASSVRVVVVPTAMTRRSLAARAIDGRGGRRADVVALRLEPMILDAVDAHRLKGAVADVQRDRGDLDAALGQGAPAGTG